MNITFNTKEFDSKMKNFIDYSVGFLEGAERGKSVFLKEFGKGVIAGLNMYIDSNARMNQQTLHHVYEWYKTGSPDARLFNLHASVLPSGIRITSNFTQSKTLSKDSKTPFVYKARVMEAGMPVTISPKKNVLAFEINGEMVFTKKTVTVANPGGSEVHGSYQKVFDSFFLSYFSQAFLKSSGMLSHLEDMSAYKTNISSGVKGGKSVGINTGYKWMISSRLAVE